MSSGSPEQRNSSSARQQSADAISLSRAGSGPELLSQAGSSARGTGDRCVSDDVGAAAATSRHGSRLLMWPSPPNQRRAAGRKVPPQTGTAAIYRRQQLRTSAAPTELCQYNAPRTCIGNTEERLDTGRLCRSRQIQPRDAHTTQQLCRGCV